MKKMFSYTKSNDEAFNSLVDCTVELAMARYEGKVASDYEDKNRELKKNINLENNFIQLFNTI